MKKFLAKILVLGLACATQAALADDATSLLRSELAKTPAAGKFIQSFAGPDGLTVAILEVPNGQKMLVYLTPDGRYMISGAVIDLLSNDNLTAAYAQKYIGTVKPVAPVTSSAALVQASKMSRVVFGNPQAPSYLQVVFDPATPQGRRLMLTTMNAAAKIAGTYLYSKMHIDFIPYGRQAAGILSGNNQTRLHNLLLDAEGKSLPPATKLAQNQALRNTELAQQLGIKPPAMISYLPGMKEAKAVSFEGADKQDLPADVQALINLTGGGAQQ